RPARYIAAECQAVFSEPRLIQVVVNEQVLLIGEIEIVAHHEQFGVARIRAQGLKGAARHYRYESEDLPRGRVEQGDGDLVSRERCVIERVNQLLRAVQPGEVPAYLCL